MALEFFRRRILGGTRHGIPYSDFSDCGRLIELRGDALPPVALIAPRRVPAVNAADHLDINVPELPRDKFVRRAGAIQGLLPCRPREMPVPGGELALKNQQDGY